ncbi:MAG: CoA transferase [Spirochaetota bacterium]|nr:CoA transferase [Spirochaetota bacterium]
MTGQALGSLKVLELCSLISGPYCSKLLGDMGAEVIKIEEPGMGDKARKRGPFLQNTSHREKSGLFLYLNTNKLGITLNINTEEGAGVFKELVKETDILIEDNPPKMMKELGLDYDNLKEINPSLIMTSITPFGQNGPHSDYKAHDLNMYFGSGLLYKPLDVPDDYKPAKGGGFFGDYLCGLSAATATLSAQFALGGTGEGQHIDISKQEALLALLRVTSVVYPNVGRPEFSMSSISGGMGGLHQCKDGYVIFTNAEEHHWSSFVKLLGDPEWANDPDLDNMFSRALNYEKIAPYIKEWMLNHNKEEIYHQGQAYGCPVAMVSAVDEVANSEQMKAREFFVDIDRKETGRFKYPQSPCRFSKTPWKARLPAPLLGEYNEEIFCKRLGYSQNRIKEMAEAGVI